MKMKILIFIAAVLALGACQARAAQYEAVTSAQFSNLCNDGRESNRAMCWGYVRGAIDAYLLGKLVERKRTSGEAAHDADLCTPGISAKEIAQLFVMYVRRHREVGDQMALPVVLKIAGCR